jgi:hypothetical protein
MTGESMSDVEITTESLGAAPLVFDYWLTSDVDFKTSVTGTNRDIASVTIIYGNVTVWATTLTQGDPTHKTTADIWLGSLKINAGATFTLTIPTQQQTGMVFAAGTLQRPGQDPVGFGFPIAQWGPPTTSASASYSS